MRSKKAIYNIISNLILQVITIIYGFIVPKIIITKFGSGVNGLISSITQFLAYITLLESGFGPVVKSILYKPIAKKDTVEIKNILKASERFFRKIAFVFLIYIGVLVIIYPICINNQFDVFFTISLIVIISISTFAEYFFGMTYKLYLQADQKGYVISIIQIATYILSTIVIIIMVSLNYSIQLIKLISGLIFVLRPLLQNIYVKRKFNIKLDDSNLNYDIKQKWDGLAQHIASVVHGNTDITLLTLFCELTEVSVYSVYYLVVKGIKQLIQVFSNSIDASFGDMIAKDEMENLNKKFDLYEIIYFMICTIVFSCAMVLIEPFVRVYTKGIVDVNYSRNVFGYLIVISEYIWAIRLPYSTMTVAAGHFKETKKGAWLEAFLNIFISTVLVIKYGIIGVTIGTIVSMLIRTIEFVYHANKYILKRNVFKSLKKILILIIITLMIIIVSNYIYQIDNDSYLNWTINAIITGLEAVFITGIVYVVVYKEKLIDVLNLIKIIKRRSSK